MDVKKIAKEEFYSEVINHISNAKESIYFYSISCCFGFYSLGLKTFEKILVALENRMKFAIKGKCPDIKVIVKIDRDSQMDMYAATRMAELEKKMGKLGSRLQDRIIFNEMANPAEFAQFLIVDDECVLLTNHQNEIYNEPLGMVLNIIEDASVFKKNENREQYDSLINVFNKSWEEGRELQIRTPQVSLPKLKYCLRNYYGPREIKFKNEREFQLNLSGYIKGCFPETIITIENISGGTRIDIAIGQGPQFEKIGIEIKYKTINKDMDAIIGQMTRYSKEYQRLIWVVLDPKFSKEKENHLREELRRIDCDYFSYNSFM